MKEGQEVYVKLLGFDDRGKVRLSMKIVDQATGKEIPRAAAEGEPEEPQFSASVRPAVTATVAAHVVRAAAKAEADRLKPNEKGRSNGAALFSGCVHSAIPEQRAGNVQGCSAIFHDIRSASVAARRYWTRMMGAGFQVPSSASFFGR